MEQGTGEVGAPYSPGPLRASSTQNLRRENLALEHSVRTSWLVGAALAGARASKTRTTNIKPFNRSFSARINANSALTAHTEGISTHQIKFVEHCALMTVKTFEDTLLLRHAWQKLILRHAWQELTLSHDRIFATSCSNASSHDEYLLVMTALALYAQGPQEGTFHRTIKA